ncbi:YigZ family protein [Pediococcus acidilactici]|uniref:YigZ family protein n=1 Tax=Pediococcus acidilactici TaxID=1254 RepID=A0AAW8YPZ1_PEDAC|nr:YigZ family protein [Pediococcus acidilactici]MDV2911806.1 YigZ family protein [Pediococcus acidilactici]WQS17322.1 YigZ family protein [Pediococcus acidilactici]
MKLILSVKEPVTTEQDIKKSRFISRIIPVQTEEEAQTKLQDIREIEAKAAHNCFAYVLGDHQDIQRASDDGEPSGTAGAPILEVLKRENLTNVLVVVTRYFGGIKLGAGGLIRAYGSSTSLAVQSATLMESVDQKLLAITIDYQNNDQLTYYLEQHQITQVNHEYTTQVITTVAVDQDQVADLKAELTGLFSGNVSFKDGGQQRVQVPYQPQ